MAKVPAGSGGLGKLESPRRYTHTQAHVFHLPSPPILSSPPAQPQLKGEKGRVSGGLGAAPGILAGPLEEKATRGGAALAPAQLGYVIILL